MKRVSGKCQTWQNLCGPEIFVYLKFVGPKTFGSIWNLRKTWNSSVALLSLTCYIVFSIARTVVYFLQTSLYCIFYKSGCLVFLQSCFCTICIVFSTVMDVLYSLQHRMYCIICSIVSSHYYE